MSHPVQASQNKRSVFFIHVKEKYVLLELHLWLLRVEEDPNALTEFKRNVSSTLAAQPTFPWIIFCGSVHTISDPWLEALKDLAQQLKAKGMISRWIGLSETLIQFFRAKGLSDLFIHAESLKIAQVQCNVPGARNFNISLLNPILDATVKVLKVQANLDVSAGRISVKKLTDPLLGETSGVISLISPVFTALIVLTFPNFSLLRIVSRVLDEEFNTVTDEVEGSAADMLNMIFDQAQMDFNQNGLGMETAIAGMLSGNASPSFTLMKGSRFLIPFSSQVGEFGVEVILPD